jgi:putative MATE family efflux protein
MRSFLSEALRDNDEDFTTGPIDRALGLLAIPMMLEMAMESIFAVVDIAFVSRLGTDAVAAVGITEALITVLYAIAIGLGVGLTAMVSRRIGAKDPHGAAQVTGQAIWVGVLLSVGIGIFGVMFARDLLVIMGASDGVIEQGTGFTAVLLGGSFSIIYLFLLNAAFRGAGDATVALRSLWLANGINIILDPCFIFGLGPFPEMGVTGAAVATTIGRGIGVAYQLWYLMKGRGRIAFAVQHLRFIPSLAWRLLRISLGGIGQFLIATSSWIGVMRIVAMFGSPSIAAYTIALRMMEFVFLPAWGLGNAAATLVGQNLGAGQPDRAEQSTWKAARYNAAFLTLVHQCARRASYWYQLSADSRHRIPDVCCRHGYCSGDERRRGYGNTDDPECHLLLAVADSARVPARHQNVAGAVWCIHRYRRFGIIVDGTQRNRIQTWWVESP